MCHIITFQSNIKVVAIYIFWPWGSHHTVVDLRGHCSLDVVNDTDQYNVTELAIPDPRTHIVAERALDRREDGFTHGSLSIPRAVDPHVMRVIDGLEESMLDQRSHAFLRSFS